MGHYNGYGDWVEDDLESEIETYHKFSRKIIESTIESPGIIKEMISKLTQMMQDVLGATTKLEHKMTSMEQKMTELKQGMTDMENAFKYIPGGTEFEEVKDHFQTLQ